MKIGWEKRPFLDVFEDKSGGNIKTPQSEYLEGGAIPIVDQGKSLIGGFTNDSERICKTRPPVIIFGDHTRCFKYIDFPFAVGADGVKVLKPKIEADTKFLFYYLNALRLTEAGYDRHFKYLKRTEIILPPIDEQSRIAAVLDKADALREKRRQAINKLDTLLQAVFLDMFGDPLSSKASEQVAFSTLVSRITYGFTCPMKHLDEGLPIITAKNVLNGSIDFRNVHYADRSEFDALTAKSKPKLGDILITKDGTIGRCAVVEVDFPFCINQSVALIETDHTKVSAVYLVGYLNTVSIQRRLKGMGKGNALQHLQITELAKMPIHFPSHEEQRKYAERIRKINDLKVRLQKSSESIDLLFHSLQQRAFNGELFNSKATTAVVPHGTVATSQPELFD